MSNRDSAKKSGMNPGACEVQVVPFPEITPVMYYNMCYISDNTPIIIGVASAAALAGLAGLGIGIAKALTIM